MAETNKYLDQSGLSRFKSNLDNVLDDVNSNIATNTATLGCQCKNFYKPNITGNTVYGTASYNLSDDGIMTISGTPSWNGSVTLCKKEIYADKKLYIAGYETLENISYIMVWYNTETGNTAYEPVWKPGRIVPKGILIKQIYLMRYEDVEGDINAVIHPLIRYATSEDIISDNYNIPYVYEPYVPNLQDQITDLSQLIEDKTNSVQENIATNTATLGCQCKNFYKPNITGNTIYGAVSYNLSDDGIMTISGTPSWNGSVTLCKKEIYADKKLYIAGYETLENISYLAALYNPETNKTTYEHISNLGRIIPQGITIKQIYLQRTESHTGNINAVIHPLIRYATSEDIISDNYNIPYVYEPYVPNLQDQITDLSERIAALEKAISTTTS